MVGRNRAAPSRRLLNAGGIERCHARAESGAVSPKERSVHAWEKNGLRRTVSLMRRAVGIASL
jgi:hypothetical protein